MTLSVPIEYLHTVSEWAWRISQALKWAIVLLILAAISTHSWITLYTGTNFSSSFNFGLFSVCGCSDCKIVYIKSISCLAYKHSKPLNNILLCFLTLPSGCEWCVHRIHDGSKPQSSAPLGHCFPYVCFSPFACIQRHVYDGHQVCFHLTLFYWSGWCYSSFHIITSQFGFKSNFFFFYLKYKIIFIHSYVRLLALFSSRQRLHL